MCAPKSFSFVPLLYVITIILVHSVYTSEHFCARLMSGKFESLHLQSFYFYGGHSDQMDLYFVEANQTYRVEWSAVEDRSIAVPGESSKWDAVDPITKIYDITTTNKDDPIDPSDRESILSVYVFSDGGTDYMYLVGETSHYWTEYRHAFSIHTKKSGAQSYRFSIASNGHVSNRTEQYTGYVISEDFVSHSDDFALYPFGTMIKQSGPKFMLKKELHYYLEKTDKPSQLRLVSSKIRPSGTLVPEKNRLLLQLPVGYYLNGSLYLFDSRTACVYIVEGLTDRGFKGYKGQTSLLSRSNVPYERFFKCNPTRFPQRLSSAVDPKRCDHTNSAVPVSLLTIWYKFRWWHYGGACALVALVIALLMGALYYRKHFKQTKGNKRDKGQGSVWSSVTGDGSGTGSSTNGSTMDYTATKRNYQEAKRTFWRPFGFGRAAKDQAKDPRTPRGKKGQDPRSPKTPRTPDRNNRFQKKNNKNRRSPFKLASVSSVESTPSPPPPKTPRHRKPTTPNKKKNKKNAHAHRRYTPPIAHKDLYANPNSEDSSNASSNVSDAGGGGSSLALFSRTAKSPSPRVVRAPSPKSKKAVKKVVPKPKVVAPSDDSQASSSSSSGNGSSSIS